MSEIPVDGPKLNYVFILDINSKKELSKLEKQLELKKEISV